jgi:hypothetical protein
MRELFGAPINEKGLSKKYLGIYKIKPQTIRLQNRNDLRTRRTRSATTSRTEPALAQGDAAQHQASSWRSRRARTSRQALQKSAPSRKALADDDTRRLQIEEGFAEFIAEYLTNPHARRRRCRLLQAFEHVARAEPDIRGGAPAGADMIGAHQALGPADKILAKVGAFKPTLRERAAALVSKDTWTPSPRRRSTSGTR